MFLEGKRRGRGEGEKGEEEKGEEGKENRSIGQCLGDGLLGGGTFRKQNPGGERERGRRGNMNKF